jgi:predicted RNase H-like HicB family nuclease
MSLRFMGKHGIIIHWSKDDDCFVAGVPELPGCSTHGTTAQEALTQVETAMALRIESAVADGAPVPEPKGRRLILA